MKIQAAIARQKEQALSIETLELDNPQPDEVLVKIVGAGICRTDIDVRDQYLPTPLPIVLGHEGSGIVEKVGANVKKVVVGDHVVLSLGSCGVCDPCKNGLPAFCEKHMPINFGGSRLDHSVCLHKNEENIHSHFFNQSSHATYSLANESGIIKVSKEIDLKYLGPFACGIMTGAGAIMNTLKPEPESCIVIFGAGTVGLSAVMAAKISGCGKIIIVDNVNSRLELAKELGATHALRGDDPDLVKAVQAINNGKFADYSLEATGVKIVATTAFSVIKELGTCVVTGVFPMGTKLEFDSWSLNRGRTLKGSVMGDCSPDDFIPKLIKLFIEGRFPVDKIMKFYPLAEINQAIEDGIKGTTIKAVILTNE